MLAMPPNELATALMLDSVGDIIYRIPPERTKTPLGRISDLSTRERKPKGPKRVRTAFRGHREVCVHTFNKMRLQSREAAIPSWNNR